MRKIVIYLVFFILNSLGCFFIGLYVGMPKTFKATSINSSLLPVSKDDSERHWLIDSDKIVLGNYYLIIPRDETVPNVALFYNGTFPIVMFEDEDEDGVVDAIILKDSKDKMIVLELIGNSSDFKNLYVVTDGKLGEDAVVYTDENVDGTYDLGVSE